MILDASNDLNIDLSKSYFVGDTAADIIAGLTVQLKQFWLKQVKVQKVFLSCKMEIIFQAL